MTRFILILLTSLLLCSCLLDKEKDSYSSNGIKKEVQLTITGEIGEARSYPEVKFECFKALMDKEELCFGANEIQGITLEKGYRYELKAKRIITNPPLQDGNLPDAYELITVISKQKIE